MGQPISLVVQLFVTEELIAHKECRGFRRGTRLPLHQLRYAEILGILLLSSIPCSQLLPLDLGE